MDINKKQKGIIFSLAFVAELVCRKKRITMSQAFVKESDEQWLHEVAPTLHALIVHLTRENNGIRVYEQKSMIHPKDGREVHVMSNGLSYAKDDEGHWYVV